MNLFGYNWVTIPLASLSGSYSKNDNKYEPKSQKDPAHNYDQVNHTWEIHSPFNPRKCFKCVQLAAIKKTMASRKG